MNSRLITLLQSQLKNTDVQTRFKETAKSILSEHVYSRLFEHLNLIGRSAWCFQTFPAPFEKLFDAYVDLFEQAYESEFKIGDNPANLLGNVRLLMKKITKLGHDELLDQTGNIKQELINILEIQEYRRTIYGNENAIHSIIASYVGYVLQQFFSKIKHPTEYDLNLVSWMSQHYGSLIQESRIKLTVDKTYCQAHEFSRVLLQNTIDIEQVVEIAKNDFASCSHERIKKNKIIFWLYVIHECGVIHEKEILFDRLFEIFNDSVKKSDLAGLNPFQNELYQSVIQSHESQSKRLTVNSDCYDLEEKQAHDHTILLKKMLNCRDLRVINAHIAEMDHVNLPESDREFIDALLAGVNINSLENIMATLSACLDLLKQDKPIKRLIQDYHHHFKDPKPVSSFSVIENGFFMQSRIRMPSSSGGRCPTGRMGGLK